MTLNDLCFFSRIHSRGFHIGDLAATLTRPTTQLTRRNTALHSPSLAHYTFTTCTPITTLSHRRHLSQHVDVPLNRPSISHSTGSRISGGTTVHPMRSHLQFLTTPTSDTAGTSILLHFQSKRYLFGSVTEGTQRATIQQGLKVQKVSEIFISGRSEWRNIGGLLGFLLTIADTTAEAARCAAGLLREKIAKYKDDPIKVEKLREQHRKEKELGRFRVTIFGPGNLNYVLATARRFIFRTSIPLVVREVPRLVAGEKESGLAGFAYQDDNIRVWALAVPPEATGAEQERVKNERKRSHDDMVGVESETNGDKVDAHDVAAGVVHQMFNSDWRIDRLVECSINEVKLPAKIFVRDPETKQLKTYAGPMPSEGNPAPETTVLVRSPWPGAVMAPQLPKPAPSEHSVSYIVKTWPQRGKFNPQKAKELGLTDPSKYGKLTAGESLVNDKGETITSDMVLGPGRESTGFVFADLPSPEYVRPFLQQQSNVPESIMHNVSAYLWTLGPGVAQHPELVAFMKSTPQLQHIVTAPDVCPDRLSFDAVAGATAKLAAVDPVRYKRPIVHESKPISLDIDNATVADRGLIFELEPEPKVSTKEITPPINFTQILQNMPPEAKAAGITAQQEVEIDREALQAWADRIPQPDTEIITLGTGSAQPSKYRNVSSTLVKVPGWGNILVDAGEDTLGQLKRVFSSDKYLEVIVGLKAIWISHLHADHHLGTASVVKEWYRVVHDLTPQTGVDLESTLEDTDLNSLASMGKRLTIMSDSAVLHWLYEYSQVEDIGFSHLNPICVSPANIRHNTPTSLYWYDSSPSQLRRFVAPITPSALGFEDIAAVHVRHCNAALAVSLTLPSGFKLSYSGDCRPSSDFAVIGKGSTVCIHEATFDDELAADARAKNHSTTSEALGVASKMGAKAVVLTHFSQRYAKVPVLEYTEDPVEEPSIPMDDEEDDTVEDPEHSTAPVEVPGKGGKSTFRLSAEKDMKVCVAFDYMRVRVGDIAQMEKFVPALLALYDDPDVETSEKQRGKQRGNGGGRVKGKGSVVSLKEKSAS